MYMFSMEVFRLNGLFCNVQNCYITCLHVLHTILSRITILFTIHKWRDTEWKCSLLWLLGEGGGVAKLKTVYETGII